MGLVGGHWLLQSNTAIVFIHWGVLFLIICTKQSRVPNNQGSNCGFFFFFLKTWTQYHRPILFFGNPIDVGVVPGRFGGGYGDE